MASKTTNELKYNGEGRMPHKSESLMLAFSGYCRVGESENEDLSSSNVKDIDMGKASGQALTVAFGEDF